MDINDYWIYKNAGRVVKLRDVQKYIDIEFASNWFTKLMIKLFYWLWLDKIFYKNKYKRYES